MARNGSASGLFEVNSGNEKKITASDLKNEAERVIAACLYAWTRPGEMPVPSLETLLVAVAKIREKYALLIEAALGRQKWRLPLALEAPNCEDSADACIPGRSGVCCRGIGVHNGNPG